MKKGLIKSAAILFAAFSLGGAVVPPVTAQAAVLERMPADRGEWRRDEHGWYYMLNVNAGTSYVSRTTVSGITLITGAICTETLGSTTREVLTM